MGENVQVDNKVRIFCSQFWTQVHQLDHGPSLHEGDPVSCRALIYHEEEAPVEDVGKGDGDGEHVGRQFERSAATGRAAVRAQIERQLKGSSRTVRATARAQFERQFKSSSRTVRAAVPAQFERRCGGGAGGVGGGGGRRGGGGEGGGRRRESRTEE